MVQNEENLRSIDARDESYEWRERAMTRGGESTFRLLPLSGLEIGSKRVLSVGDIRTIGEDLYHTNTYNEKRQH